MQTTWVHFQVPSSSDGSQSPVTLVPGNLRLSPSGTCMPVHLVHINHTHCIYTHKFKKTLKGGDEKINFFKLCLKGIQLVTSSPGLSPQVCLSGLLFLILCTHYYGNFNKGLVPVGIFQDSFILGYILYDIIRKHLQVSDCQAVSGIVQEI